MWPKQIYLFLWQSLLGIAIATAYDMEEKGARKVIYQEDT